MKKIINAPADVVSEMLEGMAAVQPRYVKKLLGFNVLIRAQPKKDKVCLVSGGGSGHEPAHGGYVGYGMLDAAVSGAVFTSPTPDQIYEAIKAVDTGHGVLLIVKNYSGDDMNFDMAAELAQADGIKIEKVIVADDVAVANSTWSIGRRGIAGTLFVHKIAGAMAEKGKSLAEVKRVAQKVIANVRSMGMAIEPCAVPEAGKPSFELKDDEMEIGIGIHGEPGTHRAPLQKADEITAALLDKIMDEGIFSEGSRVALLINGLGATPLMEQYIVAKKAASYLKERGIEIVASQVGNYMTSLEMAGFSISLLKLDDELEELLEAPADTPAFTRR